MSAIKAAQDDAVTRHGVDYAYHHALDTDGLLQAGVSFVVRYLSHTPAKNLSAAEAQTLSDAGIDLAVVWESSAQRPLAGFEAGKADAETASAQASGCGMPSGRPVYFGVDFPASGAAQLEAVGQYLQGAAAVLGVGRVGVYGGYTTVAYCFDHGLVAFGWQTSSWSGKNRDGRAQLYQHLHGVEVAKLNCDLDTAYAAEFGQWRLPGSEHPFPFPPTDYLGMARPDPHCHWGETAADKQAVARWQAKMHERGWNLPATGVFARQSDRVCRHFQAEKGLKVDGLVGPSTWEAAWAAPVTAAPIAEESVAAPG